METFINIIRRFLLIIVILPVCIVSTSFGIMMILVNFVFTLVGTLPLILIYGNGWYIYLIDIWSAIGGVHTRISAFLFCLMNHISDIEVSSPFYENNELYDKCYDKYKEWLFESKQ